MRELIALLRHIVNVVHFPSEEARIAAHGVLDDLENPPEETETPEGVDNPDPAPILSPDGTQQWTGTEWVPVVQPTVSASGTTSENPQPTA